MQPEQAATTQRFRTGQESKQETKQTFANRNGTQKPAASIKPTEAMAVRNLEKAARESHHKQFLAVLSEPVGEINLCFKTCAELDSAMVRILDYTKGRFDADNLPENDPAFQLAKLMNQAALGPATRKMFELIYRIKEDGTFLRTLGLAKLIFQLDEIRTEFAERRKSTRISEATALDERLKYESKYCSERSLPARCARLNSEIAEWIESGATK